MVQSSRKLCLCSLLAVALSQSLGPSMFKLVTAASVNVADDSNRCEWQIGSSEPVNRFPSLPGTGWDNLRNTEMGLVADLSFRDCALSDDGAYVAPRNVILSTRRESVLETVAQIYDNYADYQSSVGRSINLVSAGTGSLSIDGKLSEEYQMVKSAAAGDQLKVGRSQLRYCLYSARMRPDFKLSDTFTNRLSGIADAIGRNRMELTRYLADLVVRDFGTHAVTSLEAGGVLEKVDYLENCTALACNKFSAAMPGHLRDVLLGINSGENDGAVMETKSKLAAYQSAVRKTTIKSYGGDALGPTPNLAEWLRTLRQKIVAVDRDGVPLYEVVGAGALPGVSQVSLRELKKALESAITRYYQANAIKGCMDPGSRNFDPLANLAAECQAVGMNFSFAGVYQTCTDNNPGAGLNLCAVSGAETKNPMTGSTKCPDNYEAVPLLSTSGRAESKCKSKTKKCWIFFTCPDGQECATSSSTLKAFWCSARQDASLKSNAGMVYGGAYASDGRFVNEITQAKSCGEFFRPYQIGRDIHVCLSMDLQLAARYRIPFGGFFSCNSGNPLADSRRQSGLVASSNGTEHPGASVSEASPRRCPDGFSQVTLDTIDGCAVMQCVKGRRAAGWSVRRPPFEDPDFELIEDPQRDEDASRGGRIALGVVGSVVGLLGVVLTAWLIARKRQGGSCIGRSDTEVRSLSSPEVDVPSKDTDEHEPLLGQGGDRSAGSSGSTSTLKARLEDRIREAGYQA